MTANEEIEFISCQMCSDSVYGGLFYECLSKSFWSSWCYGREKRL